MSENKVMVYVAEDRKQPGAAWALCVDNAERVEDIAEEVAQWILDGAKVQRVDIETGREMLKRWIHPHERVTPGATS